MAHIQKFKRNGSNGAIFTVPHFIDLGIATWDVKVLNQEEVLMYENGVDITNKYLREWAKSNGLAVVDLDVLYKDVNEGRVMIGDSVLIIDKISIFCTFIFEGGPEPASIACYAFCADMLFLF